MFILHNVDLTDITYVCATYSIRRVGIQISIDNFLNIEPERYSDKDTLYVGDILTWDQSDSHHLTPALLIESDIPISKWIKFSRHYVVYEGNNIISDTQLIGDAQIPSIRLRYLKSLIHKPDGIIRYEYLKKNYSVRCPI